VFRSGPVVPTATVPLTCEREEVCCTDRYAHVVVRENYYRPNSMAPQVAVPFATHENATPVMDAGTRIRDGSGNWFDGPLLVTVIVYTISGFPPYSSTCRPSC